MTARPLRVPQPRSPLRVIQGRRIRRPVVAPWMAFAVVVVGAFLGLVVSRTALDRGAFELADLDRAIAVAETDHQHLLLEVARLESPSRVAPLAEQMGLVYPAERQPVLARGVIPADPALSPRWAGLERLALPEDSP